MAPRPDNPGVWFPPPLWYLLAIFIGVLLNRRWPLPIAESPLTIVAGICLVAGWMALASASFGRFRKSKTTIIPIRPAEALVLSGPYRYTRNPMYVSLALLTIACGLFFSTWWPIVLLVPTLVISPPAFRRRIRPLRSSRSPLAVSRCCDESLIVT
jgi:protein-S-isoprenylcysteine O-methyltransferase Ste14